MIRHRKSVEAAKLCESPRAVPSSSNVTEQGAKAILAGRDLLLLAAFFAVSECVMSQPRNGEARPPPPPKTRCDSVGTPAVFVTHYPHPTRHTPAAPPPAVVPARKPAASPLPSTTSFFLPTPLLPHCSRRQPRPAPHHVPSEPASRSQLHPSRTEPGLTSSARPLHPPSFPPRVVHAIGPIFDPSAGVQNGKRLFSSPGCNSPASLFSSLRPSHLHPRARRAAACCSARGQLAHCNPASLSAAHQPWASLFRRTHRFHTRMERRPRGFPPATCVPQLTLRFSRQSRTTTRTFSRQTAW